MSEFAYEDMLPIGEDQTPWRKLTDEGVSTATGPDGMQFLKVAPEALTLLAETAMHDIAHYLRPVHLGQLAKIMDDPEASNNDKFVALDLLKNANIAAGGVYFDRAIPHPLGTVVTLKFALPGDREMVVARGEVVSSAPNKDGLGMGVKFVHVEGDGVKRIRAFLRSA